MYMHVYTQINLPHDIMLLIKQNKKCCKFPNVCRRMKDTVEQRLYRTQRHDAQKSAARQEERERWVNVDDDPVAIFFDHAYTTPINIVVFLIT